MSDETAWNVLSRFSHAPHIRILVMTDNYSTDSLLTTAVLTALCEQACERFKFVTWSPDAVSGIWSELLEEAA